MLRVVAAVSLPMLIKPRLGALKPQSLERAVIQGRMRACKCYLCCEAGFWALSPIEQVFAKIAVHKGSWELPSPVIQRGPTDADGVELSRSQHPAMKKLRLTRRAIPARRR